MLDLTTHPNISFRRIIFLRTFRTRTYDASKPQTTGCATIAGSFLLLECFDLRAMAGKHGPLLLRQDGGGLHLQRKDSHQEGRLSSL